MLRFLIIFLFFLCSVAQAQVVSGYVYSQGEGAEKSPLPGAIVHWDNSYQAVFTDTSGYFELKRDSLPVLLRVSYIGYQSDCVLVSSFQQKVRLLLKPVKALDEVEVTTHQATTYMQSTNPMLTQVMGEGELKKAACCNLSESFETNPGIDVNYSDAVTGIKQIQLLGLSGAYSPLTVELVPATRGLVSHTGLTFIPGPWVESIQVTKGIGPVSNGYESMAGQINVELKKPEKADRIYLNAYQNSMGRMEANMLFNTRISEHWSTGLMLHGSSLAVKNDMNHDGFLDLPLGKQLNLLNRWKYENAKGFIAQFGAHIINDTKEGGSVSAKNKDLVFDSSHYAYSAAVKRYEIYSKTGYVLPGSIYKSFGLIANAYRHEQHSLYGTTGYNGTQQSASAQLLYQSVLGDSRHKYKAGLSYLYDDYNEQYKSFKYYRTEQVIGAFLEYTYNSGKKFDLIAGIRYDHHNIFGNILTPRLHIKYNLAARTALRASFGRGQRTANIFAENSAVFASSRQLIILPSSNSGTAYGLKQEVAWNSGINLVHNFKLNYREGSVVLDFYHTGFVNQVVMDLDADPHQVLFYNLEGRSFSNSAQVELNYEPIRRFDLKMAYRYYDVRTTYHGTLLQRPFVAAHRAFANLSYKTKSKWQFDYTFNFIGSKRLPSTLANPGEYRQVQRSPAYFTMNAQLSKSFFKKANLDAYLGCENITGFRQTNLILSASQPYSKYFDSSLTWGPVIGRMFYLGLRYNIPAKKMTNI